MIGEEVKSIMRLVADIDNVEPDEDMVEVLIGAVGSWGTIEAQILFPALESQLEESGELITAARKRLDVLYSLQGQMHEEEYSEEPWNALARKYIDAVKYHLLVDVQDFIPLTAQLPAGLSIQLAASMSAMKLDLE